MQAVVFPAPNRMAIEEVADPVCEPDEVIVQVAQAGICGTDLHIYRNEYLSTFPLISGHEFAGRIVEVGRRVTQYQPGQRVAVDPNLNCGECYFCGMRNAHLRDLVQAMDEAGVPAQIIAMIEHCPSGALVYAPKGGGAEVEPDLPQQVAVTTEITSDGPIAGPLWVTGSLPIERADGQPCEVRHRVTLCCCGESKNKPFCDGTHRKE